MKTEKTIFECAESNDIDELRNLLKSGADVNLQNKRGNTALMFAAWHGHTDCAELLIKSGAYVNLRYKEGSTALMFAAWDGCTDCVELLIKSGADVNLQDDDGLTALMIATKRGHKDCAELLKKAMDNKKLKLQNEYELRRKAFLQIISDLKNNPDIKFQVSDLLHHGQYFMQLIDGNLKK
jgi:ankyrin repeat protein